MQFKRLYLGKVTEVTKYNVVKILQKQNTETNYQRSNISSVVRAFRRQKVKTKTK